MEVGVGNFLMPDDSWLEACCSWCLGDKFRLAAALAQSLVLFGEQVQTLEAHRSALGCSMALLHPGS